MLGLKSDEVGSSHLSIYGLTEYARKPADGNEDRGGGAEMIGSWENEGKTREGR